MTIKQRPFTSKLWGRAEYERLVDLGVFEGQPLELIGGQLIVAEPKVPAQFDRITKGSLYARAEITDYWIVNLVDRIVEIYRDPGPDLTAPFGWRYSSVERVHPPAAVTPLGVPATPVSVAALLP